MWVIYPRLGAQKRVGTGLLPERGASQAPCFLRAAQQVKGPGAPGLSSAERLKNLSPRWSTEPPAPPGLDFPVYGALLIFCIFEVVLIWNFYYF